MSEERRRESYMIVFFFIISISILLGAVLIWVGLQGAPSGSINSMMQFLFGIITIAVAAKMMSDLMKTREKEKEHKYEVVTVLQCKNCGVKMERPTRDGEYVGMITEEKCQKCGTSSMIIRFIYCKTPLEQAVS
ncbi:MAG: hypothetical protein ACP5KE_03045 [Candidatus Methanodesulfokora sp.]